MNIQIQRTTEEAAKIPGYPAYSTPGSAAVDLRCMESIEIAPGTTEMVGTGIKVWIQDPGYYGLVVPRSGLGSRGLVLSNGTGIIDSDYQGEIMISLLNRSDSTFIIERGDRVAQMLILPVTQATFVEVKDFQDSTGRGGFGSTGTK